MPVTSLVPEGYADLVGLIGAEVRSTRLRVARAASTELVTMNWRIGRLILDRQQTEAWDSAVIRPLALDLRGEFPNMTGLSATNLQYMRVRCRLARYRRIFPTIRWEIAMESRLHLAGRFPDDLDIGCVFSQSKGRRRHCSLLGS